MKERKGEGLASLAAAKLSGSHTRSRSSDDRPRLLAPTLPPSAAVRPLPPTSLSSMPLARPLSPARRTQSIAFSPDRVLPIAADAAAAAVVVTLFRLPSVPAQSRPLIYIFRSALPRVTSSRYLHALPDRFVSLSLSLSPVRTPFFSRPEITPSPPESAPRSRISRRCPSLFNW